MLILGAFVNSRRACRYWLPVSGGRPVWDRAGGGLYAAPGAGNMLI